MKTKSEILVSMKSLMKQYKSVTEKTPHKIKLHNSTISEDEIMVALVCLLDDRITMGQEVASFENQCSHYFNSQNTIMVNSGSSANLLAISSLTSPLLEKRLMPGDEVIVPALSWSTTVWPLIQCGLVPVIVDIDAATLNIDPAEVERAISPKTKAIMPVHVYGNPCDMNALMKIKNKHKLFLIEDCCEALGATYNDQALGTFGEVGTYSLYYSHHINTMEGGFCITNDHRYAENMRIRRAHGWIRETKQPEPWKQQHADIDPRFLFVDQGFNLRVTELQGAMAKQQLPKLNSFVSARRNTAHTLLDKLSQFSDCFQFQEETENGFHSWFGFVLTINDNAGFTAEAIRQHLEKNQIETRPVICGNIAKQPAMKMYEHRVVGQLNNASHVMKNSFSIGCHQDVTQADCDHITQVIKQFLLNND